MIRLTKGLNNRDGLEIYQIKKGKEIIYLARQADSNSELYQINFDVDKRGRLKNNIFRLYIRKRTY